MKQCLNRRLLQTISGAARMPVPHKVVAQDAKDAMPFKMRLPGFITSRTRIRWRWFIWRRLPPKRAQPPRKISSGDGVSQTRKLEPGTRRGAKDEPESARGTSRRPALGIRISSTQGRSETCPELLDERGHAPYPLDCGLVVKLRQADPDYPCRLDGERHARKRYGRRRSRLPPRLGFSQRCLSRSRSTDRCANGRGNLKR
jgi:hypothetical protein